MNTTSIIILIALPFLITFGIAGLSAAPWVPTKPKQKKQLIKKLENFLPKTRLDGSVLKIYDLGCGDGTVLFAAARKYTDAKFIGFEISLLPFLIARARKLFNGRKYQNVSIHFANLFSQNLNEADIIFVFLLNKCYPRLIEKFSHELRDDAIVIVEAWPMPKIQPIKKIVEDKLLTVYVYNGAQFR